MPKSNEELEPFVEPSEGKTALEFKMVELTDTQSRSRRSRALGIAVALALCALMLYVASFARLIGG